MQQPSMHAFRRCIRRTKVANGLARQTRLCRAVATVSCEEPSKKENAVVRRSNAWMDIVVSALVPRKPGFVASLYLPDTRAGSRSTRWRLSRGKTAPTHDTPNARVTVPGVAVRTSWRCAELARRAANAGLARFALAARARKGACRARTNLAPKERVRRGFDAKRERAPRESAKAQRARVTRNALGDAFVEMAEKKGPAE